MKTAVLLIFIMSYGVAASAQAPLSYAGLWTGVSVPLGDFSSKSLDGGSFALPGWKVGAEGAWFSKSGPGAGLQAVYGVYPVDVTSLAQEKMKDNAFIDSLSIRSDPLRMITLAGLFEYSFRLSDRLSIVPKAGGGIIYGFSPYQLYKPSYYMIGPVWYEITSDRDLGGYFTTGATLRYRVCECLDLQAQINYCFGSLTYKFMTSTGDVREEKHQVMTLDGIVGFAFNF